MELETLIYEEGRIATLTLNRPETGSVLIVKANGNHFSSGYDLTEFSYVAGGPRA